MLVTFGCFNRHHIYVLFYAFVLRDTRLDPNHDSVLMGKAADKVYSISVQYPMTLFQGLTIAITAVYAKTFRA